MMELDFGLRHLPPCEDCWPHNGHCSMNCSPPHYTIIRQKHPRGCVVACYAMVLGCTYKEIETEFRSLGIWDEQGVYPGDDAKFLASRGLRCEGVYRGNWDGEWPPRPWVDLAVASVDAGGSDCWHRVVLVHDGTVLDPNRDEPCDLTNFAHIYNIRAIVKAEPGTEGQRRVLRDTTGRSHW